jgi:hypothetical protein
LFDRPAMQFIRLSVIEETITAKEERVG